MTLKQKLEWAERRANELASENRKLTERRDRDAEIIAAHRAADEARNDDGADLRMMREALELGPRASWADVAIAAQDLRVQAEGFRASVRELSGYLNMRQTENIDEVCRQVEKEAGEMSDMRDKIEELESKLEEAQDESANGRTVELLEILCDRLGIDSVTRRLAMESPDPRSYLS